MRLERIQGFSRHAEPGLFWLGQAGFWIETGRHRVLIDPYLSDSLAKKYAGKKHSHRRMMPPPISVEALPRPDIVLITHAHTDHLDPETLGPLHSRFPDLEFVVPAAREAIARERIGETANLVLVDAGDDLCPLDGLTIRVFPAAHETFDQDPYGRHPYLGYGISSNKLRIYHSGDSVPFEGLPQLVADYAPHIALLPVNGRDADRLADGIPGNFTLEEAIDLAKNTPVLIPHHFGMFDFNTADPQVIDAAAANSSGLPMIMRPVAGFTMTISA
ncbi:MAG: MBL fold metallo-hydrolase [Alphaproteobacteria bacterium]|nr:MBL fold metallo-hydrolase [Alphaproteobacteria bacterium]